MDRCFLQDNSNPAEALADHLLSFAPDPAPAADLSRMLVILPSRQAIRAVSAALASRKSVVLPPEFATSARFSRMGVSTPLRPASRFEQKAILMRILKDGKEGAYPSLFPGGFPREADVLAHCADQILDLRAELEQNPDCCTFGRAARRQEDRDPRWRELRDLEDVFLSELDRRNLADPARVMLDALEESDSFLSYDRIFSALCPDLPPMAAERLRRLARSFHDLRAQGRAAPEISICIAARPEDSYLFDEFGRVIPEKWQAEPLPFPPAPGHIHSAAAPVQMAELAVRLAPDPETGVFDSSSTLIANAGADSYFELERAFSRFRTENGRPLRVCNPSGVSMGRLRIAALTEAFRSLIAGEHPSADVVRRLLEQESFLRFLAASCGMTPDILKETADVYFLLRIPDEILPSNFPDPALAFQIAASPEQRNEAALRMSRLADAFHIILEFREILKKSENLVHDLNKILQKVFSGGMPPPCCGIPLKSEADAFREILREFEVSPLLSRLSPENFLLLLQDAFSRKKLYPEPAPGSLEISGFLDAMFCPADRVILCGMNEGVLPETIAPTPFLNDSIRKTLGLPNNESRYARDAFYLKSLLRKTNGRIHFISCKTDADGGALRFSSLFFNAADSSALLERAAVLFESVSESSPGAGTSREPSFLAEVDLRKAFTVNGETVLNVTDFALLLESPLHAFLERVLRMQPADYLSPELDPASLGTFFHRAVQHFEPEDEWISAFRGPDPVRRASASEQAFQELFRLFRREFTTRLGKNLPLLPMIQLERWIPRLRKTSEQLLGNSAEVLEKEWRLGGGNGIPFRGARIKGTIDRIEYDRTAGTLRLIDFKTGADAADPKKAHVNSRRFLNLQLPLYKILLSRDPAFQEKYPEIIQNESLRFLCGYFSVSSVVRETGYAFWADMDRYEEAASETAGQVIKIVKTMQSGFLPEDLFRKKKHPYYQKLFPYGEAKAFSRFLHTVDPMEPPAVPKAGKEVEK